MPLYVPCPIFSLNIFVEETRSSFLQSFSIFYILMIVSLPIVIYHVPLSSVLLIYPYTDQTNGAEQIQFQYLATFDYWIQVLSVRSISFQVYNHVFSVYWDRHKLVQFFKPCSVPFSITVILLFSYLIQLFTKIWNNWPQKSCSSCSKYLPLDHWWLSVFFNLMKDWPKMTRRMTSKATF